MELPLRNVPTLHPTGNGSVVQSDASVWMIFKMTAFQSPTLLDDKTSDRALNLLALAAASSYCEIIGLTRRAI